MKKFTVEIQRSTVVMANAFIKTIKHPAATILSKITDRVDAFLKDYPGDKYRLTAECIDDAKPSGTADREDEEERADPSEAHYR
jgi:hypothetical protein